jgi:hypothetical protein
MQYRLLDYPVAITASDREATTAVRAILAGFPQPEEADPPSAYELTRGEDGGWCVTVRGTLTVRGARLADAVAALEWQLVSDALATRLGRFQLHGAALESPSGDTSLLVLGASGAGKTTLTLALMARGFLPYTDDIVFLEPDTLVPETFPRAFHVDPPARVLVEALPEQPPWRFDGLPPGHATPARWATRGAPVRAVFFPTVHPGAAPEAGALSIADATAALLDVSATLDQAPELALAIAARLTAQAPCYALRSGDLAATAALVADLAARSAPRAAWRA